MAGCETLTVKLKSSVRREAARGQDRGACDVRSGKVKDIFIYPSGNL